MALTLQDMREGASDKVAEQVVDKAQMNFKDLGD